MLGRKDNLPPFLKKFLNLFNQVVHQIEIFVFLQGAGRRKDSYFPVWQQKTEHLTLQPKGDS